MQINVELFGQLLPKVKRYQTMKLESIMSAQEVANLLGLNIEEIGLIVIDGKQSDMKDLVSPGCRLCFFPHMTGG